MSVKVVECLSLKLCFNQESVKCCEIMLRTSLSSIFEWFQSSEIGLLEIASEGVLLDFRIRMIFARYTVTSKR